MNNYNNENEQNENPTHKTESDQNISYQDSGLNIKESELNNGLKIIKESVDEN
ncbi:MAG: hypothetical protein LKG42_04565 [Eubacterium sp.]|nr:hypothetical protein [Eubacterium sp.]MCH4047377.1 hypothetical protein [Eubacterium sp.]MCH4080474.1 hypothetical protein [Eubacterium sp.]MCI1307271.1 hypothetical protein [Eubacterium sp.]MCI1405714.1 hypothetical protein [Eubacterium sp.]